MGLSLQSMPIVYYFVHGEIVWGCLGINVLLFAGLFALTAILLYFGERLPMNPFSRRRVESSCRCASRCRRPIRAALESVNERLRRQRA
jgi:hypothetical protein